jgi:hypothetical protein
VLRWLLEWLEKATDELGRVCADCVQTVPLAVRALCAFFNRDLTELLYWPRFSDMGDENPLYVVPDRFDAIFNRISLSRS